MARKRVVEAPSLHSWEDVNDALRQIAEAQIALGEIQSDMQKQILGAQKVAEEQSKPLNDNVAKLEREIKSFVTDHRDEMGKTKSMVLTFGEVGFRLSTSVSLPRAKEKLEEIIRRLKSRQMTDCIVVEEKVSKEALKKYGEDTVNAVGATWKQSDVFGYEVNIAEHRQAGADQGGQLRKGAHGMTAARTGRKQPSIRTLWAIAKSPELHLTDEDLHAVVYRETGKESMKMLTQGEVNTVARVLQNMKDSVSRSVRDKRTDTGGDIRTTAQRRKIYALCEALGWNDDPRRIQGFVKRVAHVDRIEWLNMAQCEKVIEGLKAILARQRRKEAEL